MTEIVQRNTSTALSISSDQTGFNDTQLAALQQIGVDTNRPADVAVFFHQAKATGLDPFKREIYMITRKGKPTIQTGIDGFYKIADRASRANGGTWGIPETYWCGPDGVWTDVWLQKEPPAAAKVTVERDGSKFTTVAITSEYQAAGPMWQKMPARMIAKCAEALAIRRAFPDDLSGLYTTEEMQQADNPVNQRPQQNNGQSRIAQARQQTQARQPQAGPTEATITEEQWGHINHALLSLGIEGARQPQAIADITGRTITKPMEIWASEFDTIMAALTEGTVEDAEIVEETDNAGQSEAEQAQEALENFVNG